MYHCILLWVCVYACCDCMCVYTCADTHVCLLHVLYSLGFVPHLLNLPPLLLQVAAVLTHLPCHLVQDGGITQLAKMQPRLCAPKVSLQQKRRSKGRVCVTEELWLSHSSCTQRMVNRNVTGGIPSQQTGLKCARAHTHTHTPVSYTHLTLPTILRV